MNQPRYATINLKGKRVLVTGGTGSIGGHLVERLVMECQAEVRVLIRNFARASRVARFPIQMVPGDIVDPSAVHQAMEGCDIVFHLAYGSSKETTQGTKNVLKAALEHKLERVVHVSTISVYGQTADGDLDESALRKYSGESYADSKLKAEKLAFHYFRKYGVPVSIIQPTIVYGPFIGSWTVRIINQLKNERVILPEEAKEGLCNAVYVDDVVEAMLLVATRDKAVGEAFLISAEEPVTWWEFYAAYEQILGTKSVIFASQSDLADLNRQYKREHGTIHQVLTTFRRIDVLLWITQLPAVARFIRLTEGIIPRSWWQHLKNTIILHGSTRQSGPLVSEEKPLRLLTDAQNREFKARTRVRIDKAKRLLGYQPRFDLEEGMRLTEIWAKYANLV